MINNSINKKGSSETTREAFCFNLYECYKLQHIKTFNFAFLTFFISFSKSEVSFIYCVNGMTLRFGFSMDLKNFQIWFYIKKHLDFQKWSWLKILSLYINKGKCVSIL